MTPSNYSFIDTRIAGSAIPYNISDIKQFISDGITDLVSLTPNKPLITKHIDQTKLRLHHIPVYAQPDEKQITKFLNLVNKVEENNGKIVVHCQYGQERTGIFLVIYLVEKVGLPLKTAIAKVRRIRPSSLKSPASIDYLHKRYEGT